MKIRSSEFVVNVSNLRQLPKTGLQEIAFLGRSNVGKSSLISTLCQKKSLARSSSTPGKTQGLNYYLINGQFYFVDLPGYGYASLPQQIRASLGSLIEEYLKKRRNLSFVVQLVDARHDPTALDLMMIGWLNYYEIPFVVALTKSDKLPKSKTPAYLRESRNAFSRFRYCTDVIMSSSVTGEGKPSLMNAVSLHLTQRQSL